MALLAFSALLLFVAQIRSLDARAPTPDDDVFITTGRFVEIDSSTGRERSLSKEGIRTLNDNHRMRLYFGDELPPMDMQLFEGSVWGKDSVLEVREGSHRSPLIQNVDRDGSCYMHGSVEDPEGAVTINKCGSVTALIQTPDHRYEMEELVGSSEVEEGRTSHTSFKVTRRKQEVFAAEQEYDQMSADMVENEAMNTMAEMPSNGTDRMKRRAFAITIELIVYLDANFVSYLHNERNLDTEDKIRNFIISKWGTVQGVYSNTRKIGARVKIDLKRIVIWKNNPVGYPGDDVGVNDRIKWFCRNTRDTDHYDQKILYTKGTAGHQMGVAYLNSACRVDFKCGLVKSPTENVRFELHEMGHNIGFKHDPKIGGCTTPGGFMGWDNTYRYLQCYKTVLRRNLRKGNLSCFFEKNVPDQE